MIKCNKCGSGEVVKNGIVNGGNQRYKCKGSCGRSTKSVVFDFMCTKKLKESLTDVAVDGNFCGTLVAV